MGITRLVGFAFCRFYRYISAVPLLCFSGFVSLWLRWVDAGRVVPEEEKRMMELSKQAAFQDDRLAGKRQQVLDRLTDAFSLGYLDMDAYEQRVEAATTTQLPVVLDGLVMDLPSNLAEQAAAPQGTVRTALYGSNTALSGLPRMNTACIMGDKRYSGNWLESDKVTAFTLMGSTRLDLCDCQLPPGPTSIELFTLMGDIHITVPASIPVRFNVTSIMADAKIDRAVNQKVQSATSWIEVSGLVLMGDVKVKAG